MDGAHSKVTLNSVFNSYIILYWLKYTLYSLLLIFGPLVILVY